MTPPGSVSAWIGQLKSGEEAALDKLHQRYWRALVELARHKLKGAPRQAADEEDIAQEAFWSFYRSLRAGKLPRLDNRHHLLALLTHIVACKASNYYHAETSAKRDQGRVEGGVPLETLAREGQRTPLEDVILRDCYAHYLDGLAPQLREFGELYLAGFTQPEIGERLQCVERTVQRKIKIILEKWQQLAAANLPECESQWLSGPAAISG